MNKNKITNQILEFTISNNTNLGSYKVYIFATNDIPKFSNACPLTYDVISTKTYKFRNNELWKGCFQTISYFVFVYIS